MAHMPPRRSDWPYPPCIAHRGAGRLAPENTLAAFEVGARLGWRMFECDAQLSADGVVFLLHDDTLERTTNGTGLAANWPWATLHALDAGSWHSPRFAGEPLPTLATVARLCLTHGYCLNIEIKSCPGRAYEAGAAVARQARQLWSGAAGAVPPLLSSFQPQALEAAMGAAPELPRGLLLTSLHSGWLETAQSLACVTVICDHTQWTRPAVHRTAGAGLRALAYTVNEAADMVRLRAWGIDGIISDSVDRFTPE